MSALLEDVTEQLSFEGLAVNAVRVSATLSDADCRLDGKPVEVNIGDRLILAEGAEIEITDIHFTEKRKDLDNGRSVGVGPVTRKHAGKFSNNTIELRSVQRRESEEDRVRRMTR